MGKRILVVESSPTIRALLDIYLHQQEGHALMQFEDYEGALRRLAHPTLRLHPPELALVALYHERPESVQVLAFLACSGFYTRTALVALIAQQEESDRKLQRAIQDARATLLLKPFRIQDVLALAAYPASVSMPAAMERVRNA